MDTLAQFKKSIIGGTLLAALYVLIAAEVLGPDFYTFVIVGALAVGVLLFYEIVIYIFNKTSDLPRDRHNRRRRPGAHPRKR